MLNDIILPDHIQWRPTTDQTLYKYQAVALLPNSTFCRIFRGFHRTFATDGHADRGRLLLRTPGPIPFGTCIVFYLLRPILFPNLSLFFQTMHFVHPSVLSRFLYVIKLTAVFNFMDSFPLWITCVLYLVMTSTLIYFFKLQIVWRSSWHDFYWILWNKRGRYPYQRQWFSLKRHDGIPLYCEFTYDKDMRSW